MKFNFDPKIPEKSQRIVDNWGPIQLRLTEGNLKSVEAKRVGQQLKMIEEITVIQHLPSEPTQGGSYTFAGVSRQAVTYANHGLHKYPAKFIPQFPKWALEYSPADICDTVLDPFCGSGTTLIESGLRGNRTIGIDISPLACVISKAKCITSIDVDDARDFLNQIIGYASVKKSDIQCTLEKNIGQSVLGMHYTWSNWFEPDQLSDLISLKDAIDEQKDPSLKAFALSILSAITKSCSYLNEDQIKVRYDHGKILRSAIPEFSKRFTDSVRVQSELAAKYREAGATFDISVGTASSLNVESNLVDRIITSPPYINAVDYTMAHKYNLFVLGLLDPEKFKDHCRDYIGVTERAVRASDIKSPPVTSSELVQYVVTELQGIGTPTAINRAYVVAQYFQGMERSFREAFRVLRTGGLYFLVVGEVNRICGITINTASILEELANSSGLRTELSFFHVLANRSSMRLNRSETGGTISRELVYVFRKH